MPSLVLPHGARRRISRHDAASDQAHRRRENVPITQDGKVVDRAKGSCLIRRMNVATKNLDHRADGPMRWHVALMWGTIIVVGLDVLTAVYVLIQNFAFG